jgi:hypothetical protein
MPDLSLNSLERSATPRELSSRLAINGSQVERLGLAVACLGFSDFGQRLLVRTFGLIENCPKPGSEDHLLSILIRHDRGRLSSVNVPGLKSDLCSCTVDCLSLLLEHSSCYSYCNGLGVTARKCANCPVRTYGGAELALKNAVNRLRFT